MIVLKALIVAMPWPVKRLLLKRLFGYRLDRRARIGFSWFYPRHLAMEAGARVGHLNVAVHLDQVVLGANATLGRSNWITGFPSGTPSPHFAHQPERTSVLTVGRESAITKGHHLDCTAPITIGEFVTVAGYDSQLLTHSIDMDAGCQDSAPIEIGDYCFVGTRSVILGGSSLPDRSVLGAMSLLNSRQHEECALYGGTPAALIKRLPAEAAYFHRVRGFVD